MNLKVQERYQNFSAEILRLSLLGIATIGFITTKIFLVKDFDATNIDTHTKYSILLSLIAFGLSSMAGLVHRYCVVDLLSWQMQSLRRDSRASELADEKKEEEKEQAKNEALFRYNRWKTSKVALITSSTSLAIASLILATTFGRVFWIIGT